jgi:hypothetical protein
MRKILFAVIMAAGVGLVGTSASAAPGAPIRDGMTNANVLEAAYPNSRYSRYNRPHARTFKCRPGTRGCRRW